MTVDQIDLSANRICLSNYLGIIPYETAIKLQNRLKQARREGNIPNVFLLLEHEPVITIGRFKGADEITTTAEVLAQEGIAICSTNRGGSITYHGPGQLVGYPILNLRELGLGVREYINKLEEVIIRLLANFGIWSNRANGFPGSVWVDKKKVCSIGIHVGHQITSHGFALNVNTNLHHFNYINACGIKSKIMTSISQIVGYCVKVEDVTGSLMDIFSEIFALNCIWGLKKCLDIQGAQNG